MQSSPPRAARRVRLCGWWAWVFCLVFAGAESARADGKVLPPVLLPQEVAMPDQRALVAWRDGVETLVIESAFVGTGADFAWVVPLPAKPEVEAATRGTLASMAALMRPVVIPPERALWWLAGSLAAVALWTLVLGWRRTGFLLRVVVVATLGALVGMILAAVVGFGWLVVPAAMVAACWVFREVIRKEASLFSHLVVAIFGLLAFWLVIPTTGKVRSMDGPTFEVDGVTVERHVVGDHDVNLVSGSDEDGVVGWLRKNGYAIEGEAEAVAREHAAAGGWFAASRVRRERVESGRSVPAPLMFRFPAERPVYPMRLTGAGATRPLELELFVLGPERAEVRGLETMAWGPVRIGDPEAGAYGRGVRQPRDAREITHPVLARLAEGASVVTHLRGRLAPSEMREDLRPEWRAEEKTADGLVAWAREAAAQFALAAGAGLALVGSIIIGFRRDGARAPGRALCATLVAAVAAGAVVFAWLPSVATREAAEGKTIPWYDVRQVPQVAMIALAKLDPATAGDGAAKEVFAAELKKILLEPSGWEMEIGDGPGQVELVKTAEGKWRTVLYDAAGQARYRTEDDFEMGWDIPRP